MSCKKIHRITIVVDIVVDSEDYEEFSTDEQRLSSYISLFEHIPAALSDFKYSVSGEIVESDLKGM